MWTNTHTCAACGNINSVTLEETMRSDTEDFPYLDDLCDVRGLPNHMFPWHWHGEVELFVILEGDLEYVLPGGVYPFSRGDVGFVNANVLHMTRCQGDAPCLQQEHIFLPELIGGARGGLIERRYVRPLLAGAPILTFRAHTAEARAASLLMEEARGLFAARPYAYEIEIRHLMTRIWLMLPEKADVAAPAQSQNMDDARIKDMLRFIAQHYASPLTLAEIAAAAHISERECCRCFSRMLGETPFSYLLRFRVDKACEALRATDQSVLAIAGGCGFSSSSYFGKIFRQRMGCSPSQYRAG